MKPPSERVTDQLTRHGGLACDETVQATIAQTIGADRARIAVGLAVIAGRVERVRLLDGSDGLRLREAARAPW